MTRPMVSMHQPIPSNPLVIFVGLPTCHPPTITQSNLSMKHTSFGMTFFGVSLILLSSGSIGMSAYIIIKIGSVDVASASICSGTFFFILGILSIYGGSSVWERKGTIIMNFIFGIVGIIAALATISFTVGAMKSGESCNKCHRYLFNTNKTRVKSNEEGGACDFMCIDYPYLIMGCLATVEGLFSLFLSCVICCYYSSCGCCYKTPPTNVDPLSFPNIPTVTTNVAFTRLPDDEDDYHLED